MNRAELVENVAKATGTPKSEVTRTLSAFIHTITGALAKGDKVTLVGFGTFERRMRKARTGRNPRTLAPLKIAAARVPAFRAGKELKDIVNGRSKQPNLVLAKPKAAAAKPAAKKAAKPAAKKAAKPAKKAAKRAERRDRLGSLSTKIFGLGKVTSIHPTIKKRGLVIDLASDLCP